MALFSPSICFHNVLHCFLFLLIHNCPINFVYNYYFPFNAIARIMRLLYKLLRNSHYCANSCLSTVMMYVLFILLRHIRFFKFFLHYCKYQQYCTIHTFRLILLEHSYIWLILLEHSYCTYGYFYDVMLFMLSCYSHYCIALCAYSHYISSCTIHNKEYSLEWSDFYERNIFKKLVILCQIVVAF